MTARARFLHLIDYSTAWAVATFVMLFAAYVYLPALRYSSAFAVALMAAITVWLFLVWYCGKHHEPGMCTVCARRFPTNPGTRAEGRARLLLQGVHWVYTLGAFLYQRLHFSAASAVWASTAVFIFGPIMVFMFTLPGLAALAASLLHVVLIFHAAQRHRQLRQYCPWCRHGGGGGGARPQTPEPAPTTGRPRKGAPRSRS